MFEWLRRRRQRPPAQERPRPLVDEARIVIYGFTHTLRLHHRVLEDDAYLINRRRPDVWGKPYWQVSLTHPHPDDLEYVDYCELFAEETSARLMYGALIRHPRVPHRPETSDPIVECW